MNWQQAVEKTVTGLGYDLVDCDLVSRGLLCVTIDRVPGHVYGDQLVDPGMDDGPAAVDLSGNDAVGVVLSASAAAVASVPIASAPLVDPGSITVEDCEKVTRQLQYVLEVEGVDYARLEVSSPGVDRPLRKAADFERFSGEQVDITLKAIFQGRKKYRGQLLVDPGAERYELIFNDGKEDQVLGFELAEIRDARLVPMLNFKGRSPDASKPDGAAAKGAKRARPKRANAKAKQYGPESGGHEE